ncbi:stage III sporulation protein AF [Paenibacillus sp. FSL R7-0273]|uniref:stage III sporulation protein AF n=1 Tax=Paenibacillus sp. FSL R7-0273 TaxID=1536772 RepID=UPI0006949503|nr:stage III sporulation protein AF [Paenibacillus sp. FSL R7-0273]OMF86992.1 stage III sporulation protein AF [Paenibacillus sp. FSL R7-0273]
MTWLGDWLRELILVVLMAAFVEMLLPGKSMERYARLVLSLLVLLTMLSPVVSLLKGDAAKELSTALVQQEQKGGLFSGAGQGAGTLEQILADGRMLAAGAKEQSLQLAAEEVAGQMQEQVAGSTGLQGVKVTVKLGLGKASGLGGDEVPVITAVTVSLPAAAGAGQNSGTKAAGTGSSPGAGPIRIEPVVPVQVQIGDSEAGAAREATAGASGGADGGQEAGAANNAATAEGVIRLLETNWNLERGIIRVSGNTADTGKS